MSPPLILASTSRYKRSLLERLQVDFRNADPEVDEQPHADESAEPLASRLAMASARLELALMVTGFRVISSAMAGPGAGGGSVR